MEDDDGIGHLRFEWDGHKAFNNVRDHGVTFEEASTVFSDPHQVETFDDKHSGQEDRTRTIGLSERLRLLLVVTTERHETIRIISARRASQSEEARYAGQDQR